MLGRCCSTAGRTPSAGFDDVRSLAGGIEKWSIHIDATVWIIDGWDEHCDPASIQVREPALYLELDFTEDSTSPYATVHEPAYLTGVEPCSKVQVAIAHVIEAFGTCDRAADFTYDGTVDACDLDAVLGRFSSGTR
jgi:hypothetical protein